MFYNIVTLRTRSLSSSKLRYSRSFFTSITKPYHRQGMFVAVWVVANLIMLVNYDSRVVITCKLHIFMTLES